LLTTLALAACTPPERPTEVPPVRPSDPASAVDRFAASLEPSGPYRDPSRDEREQAAEAVGLLLDDPANLDRATAVLGGLGFTARRGDDPATRRPYMMFSSQPGDERAWGIILVDLSAPVRLAVEVPHPNSDLRTEVIGTRLFHRVPGSVLLVAGAHRRAAGDEADVAHNGDSLFNVAATQFAERQLNQVQLHGFAEESLPGADVVVSPGAASASGPLRRAAEQLTRAGFQTCRAWLRRCGRLEGTTNAQADRAAGTGSVFVHVEISWTVRADDARDDALVDALAKADLTAP
jgi:hypothetical protein